MFIIHQACRGFPEEFAPISLFSERTAVMLIEFTLIVESLRDGLGVSTMKKASLIT